jgi:hypothetical protein
MSSRKWRGHDHLAAESGVETYKVAWMRKQREDVGKLLACRGQGKICDLPAAWPPASVVELIIAGQLRPGASVLDCGGLLAL